MDEMSWGELAAATLARQVPAEPVADVVTAVAATGPIQTQVARSAYVGLAARRPGTSHPEVEAAYTTGAIVRGSSLRGTVHTVPVDLHPATDVVARAGTAAWWRRQLGTDPEPVQADLESFAAEAWRTPDELRAHLAVSVERVTGSPPSAAAGRQLGHLHSGLVRRPVGGVGWHRQTPPEYRLARCVAEMPEPPPLDDATDALVMAHLRAFGPASIADLAGWLGLGKRAVQASLVRLTPELVDIPGPDGVALVDGADLPRPSSVDVGTRLLAEYDGLIVAYAPSARRRFVDEAARDFYWTMGNGQYTSVLLHDGRLRGSWKLTGPDAERRLTVRMFPGERQVGTRALRDAVAGVAAVLDIATPVVGVVPADID